MAMEMDATTIIVRRVAQELRPNTLVNLGIGMPTKVAGHLPPGVNVFFQSENGLLGMGPVPPTAWRTQTLPMPEAASSPPFRVRRPSTAPCRSA